MKFLLIYGAKYTKYKIKIVTEMGNIKVEITSGDIEIVKDIINSSSIEFKTINNKIFLNSDRGTFYTFIDKLGELFILKGLEVNDELNAIGSKIEDTINKILRELI